MIILLYFTVIKNKLIILYNRYITASFTRRIKLTICKSCDCRWSSWENGGKVYHYFIVWAVSVYPSFATFFEISQKFSLSVRTGMNFIFIVLLLLTIFHFSLVCSDFLMMVLKDLLLIRPDVRVVMMSATLNAQLFSEYFYDAPVIHIPGIKRLQPLNYTLL